MPWLVAIEGSAGGANLALVARQGTIQRPAIGQTEHQLGAPLTERGEVDLVEWRDTPFDLKMCGHRFPLRIGEMLVYRQVVMHAPKAHAALEYLAVVAGLFNESLHGATFQAPLWLTPVQHPQAG
jgi:hypothetical protein